MKTTVQGKLDKKSFFPARVKQAINNDRWLWRDGIEENPVSHAVCLEMLKNRMVVVEKFSKENKN